MTSINAKDSVVHFNDVAYKALNAFLRVSRHSKIFVLVDTNTHNACLPKFLARLQSESDIEIIEIPDGEHFKTIDTCVGVWNTLSDLDADRKSVLINLGGGVVTDLGGFVACTFKRGIDYINVPTSLLAMVDASVGGKTGVDLGVLKNQVGVISSGKMVLIDTSFLDTLPQNQLRSGLAEMLKHGLIGDRDYWNRLKDLSSLTLNDLDALIYESVVIKNNIVSVDPLEDGIRKTLNFGHTLGHAIESYFLSESNKPDLLHGEAIAIGMVLESYISSKLLGFDSLEVDEVKQVMLNSFEKVQFDKKDCQPIIDLMKYDKKNSHGIIKFVLLEAIGQPKIDCQVHNELILEAFNYYNA